MYEDEKIISQRNEEIKSHYNDIRTGVFIGKQFYRFEETSLPEMHIKMLIPDNFTDMSTDMLRKKYPSEQRPQIVKTNQSGTINFTFNILNSNTEYEDLSGILSGFIMTIRSLFPGTMFLEKGVEDTEIKYNWMEFKSNAVNGAIYNWFFLTVISDNLLMGTFNCPMRDWPDWKPYLKEIMSSFYELEE